jgi:hypothetical protein
MLNSEKVEVKANDPSIYPVRCPLLLVNRSMNPQMMSYPWRFTPSKKNLIT